MNKDCEMIEQCCKAANLLNKLLVPYNLALDLNFFSASDYEFDLCYFDKGIKYIAYELDECKNAIKMSPKTAYNSCGYFIVEGIYYTTYNRHNEYCSLNKWFDLDTLLIGNRYETSIFELDDFFYINTPPTNIKHFASTSLDELELKLDLCGI